MNENNNINNNKDSNNEDEINIKSNKNYGSSLEFNNLFGDGLQFIKITERIFALLFHSGSDSIYRNNIKTISEHLKKTFLDKYKIFNLSQKRSDLGRSNQQGNVLEFGWPEPLSPPLDRLCSICKQLENHLNSSKENIAIIHCKGGIYRVGIVITAFMNYTNICAGEENLADRFSMKLFTEKYMGINTQPSHKRILKENTLIEMTGNTKQSLRGDVLLKCYQIIDNNEKQLLFQCQFNTCALGIECLNIPKIFFTKMELDSIFIDNKACLELAFEVSREPRRSNTPRRGKSASPRSYHQLSSGGDFSRADSYENFERAEDERSLSLPIGANNQNLINEDNCQKLNNEIKLLINQPILKEISSIKQLNNNLNLQQTADGADSGIGSDSPKVVASQLILPSQNGGQKQQIVEENNEKEQQQQIDQEFNKINNMPPPVPPKSSSIYKHSPLTLNFGKDVDQQLDHQIQHCSPKKQHSEKQIIGGEGEEENDPMRSAFEDSTIGRDHSVLPPGARSSRRLSPHTDGGRTSASSGDERPRRRVIISPMVQPQLVATGRYDPNSRCFSYVPAKSLKEHYKAPKKPSLKRRTSVIEPADLEVSPLEAKMALENFGLQSSSSEAYRKAETPKWEAEIDKLTGGKIEHRPRRASTAGTPVGHIQHDYVRSPSAAQTRSPQNDWNYRQQQPHQWNLPTTKTVNYQKTNGDTNKWTDKSLATQRISRVQMPNRDSFNTMTTSMPSSTIQIPFTEQPMVFEQAKRATPTLLQQKQTTTKTSNSYSPHAGTRRRPIPGVRPSPRRTEMDVLCDPEFYLSYSTPTASSIFNKKYPQKEKNIEEFLSKSVPDKKEFNQMAKNELQRDDVKELLSQHFIGNNNKGTFNPSVRRSQTPQNPLINSKELIKPLQIIDEYRKRNCRSVNSTPLIGNRRLFLYKDEPSTDPECAEDWLYSKLQALKGRREPIVRNKKETEKLLLQELKNKATIKENESTDPLEEYKKEEQRLKNTKSSFMELDGLRKANKYLQNERAKQNFFKQNPSFISSTISKSYPSSNDFFVNQRSLSAAPTIKEINGQFNFDSPIQSIKRGATPTGQIISSKPPTPPLNLKGDRERSKSPHNSKLIFKNSSKKSFEELEEPLQSTFNNNSDVNPNLLALRQSLYAKERPKNGVCGNQQQKQINNEIESSILNKKQFNEDSSNQQQLINNNCLLERSDTPQFPLVSDRETPLPYHPLLYKNDDPNQKLISTKNNINQFIQPNN
uniref:Phosphatase tensin-type domain-containing protein n=1 Tax=Meloidogyne hapla TaxID=6305 RepID=A0A1I8BIR6_MELHA